MGWRAPLRGQGCLEVSPGSWLHGRHDRPLFAASDFRMGTSRVEGVARGFQADRSGLAGSQVHRGRRMSMYKQSQGPKALVTSHFFTAETRLWV